MYHKQKNLSLWNALHMRTLSTIAWNYYKLSRTPNEDKAITKDTGHYLFQLLIYTIKITEDWNYKIWQLE